MENLNFIFQLISSTYNFKFIFKFIDLLSGFLLVLGIINFLMGCRFRKNKERIKRYFELGRYCIYFSANFSLLNILRGNVEKTAIFMILGAALIITTNYFLAKENIK